VLWSALLVWCNLDQVTVTTQNEYQPASSPVEGRTNRDPDRRRLPCQRRAVHESSLIVLQCSLLNSTRQVRCHIPSTINAMASSSLKEVVEGKEWNWAQQEERILALWDELNAFDEQLKRTEGKPEFVFFDGPPFATGLPHYGHILAGTLKVGAWLGRRQRSLAAAAAAAAGARGRLAKAVALPPHSLASLLAPRLCRAALQCRRYAMLIEMQRSSSASVPFHNRSSSSPPLHPCTPPPNRTSSPATPRAPATT